MRVFVAGASGAIGQQLVPMLVERGHVVAGSTRTSAKAPAIERAGAKAYVLDALDGGAVRQAVEAFQPAVIVHELTELKGLDMRHFDRDFEMTNRLRTEGARYLLEAGRAVGIQRFVAQSFSGWPFDRSGGPIKTEDDPLDPDPAPPMRPALDAIEALEQMVLEATWTEGIVLRYGSLYGPGTGLDVGGEQLELIRKRQWPIIGSGAGIWSFVHVADAAEATAVAVESGRRGIYQIVDDEPVAAAEWLPVVAERIGAPRPFHIPRFLGRLLAGEAGAVVMTEIRGGSNAKAKRELGWRPRHSWRTSLGAR